MMTEALDLDEIEERRVHDLDIDRLLAQVREGQLLEKEYSRLLHESTMVNIGLQQRVTELEAALAEMTEQRDRALDAWRYQDAKVDELWKQLGDMGMEKAAATRAERERCLSILERHTTRTSADIAVDLDAVRREIEEG